MTYDPNSRMAANILDDEFKAVTPCMWCKHRRRGQLVYINDQPNLTCDAFPSGVPKPIARGEHDHKTPFPGDHGIMFERVEEEDKA